MSGRPSTISSSNASRILIYLGLEYLLDLGSSRFSPSSPSPSPPPPMAKSLRSKSKRKFRAIKRDTLFGQVELERTRRLSAKLADNHTKPSVEVIARQSDDQMTIDNTTEIDNMEVVVDAIDTGKTTNKARKKTRQMKRQWRRKRSTTLFN